MSAIHLNFARSIYHDNGIFEVIPDQGIEVTAQHIDEIRRAIEDLDNNVGILINKGNEYSHTFEAIQAIRELCKTCRIAMYAPTKMSQRTTTTVLGNTLNYDSVGIFDQRQEAIIWLLALT